MAPRPFDDENEEKPLDPATERVRRKLVRFVAINLGLLFAAVMIVLAALVYKTLQTSTPAAGEVAEADIALPAGAKVIGHGFTEGKISIDAELADGSRTIFVYDVAAERIVGRYHVSAK